MAGTVEQKIIPGRGRLTLDDIARHVSVGRATVAHVMAGRADRLRIAKDTQARVLQAAQELGYVPNTAAKATARGRVGRVAMVMGSVGRNLSLGFVTRAARSLSSQGMTLSFAEVPDAKLTSSEYMPRILQDLSADGLLMAYNDRVPSEMARVIAANAIPTIWVNAKRPQDGVYPDDFAAGRRATELLLAAGHRRVAYLGFGDGHHYSVADRRDGYAAAMSAAGLAPRVELLPQRFFPPDELQTDDRVGRCAALLARDDRPTAFVCYEREAALPVAFAAAGRGLRVPQDLSIVTFAELMVNDPGVPVTTMMIPTEALGVAAAEMMIEKIEAAGRSVDSRAVPFDGEVGHTIAPPPVEG